MPAVYSSFFGRLRFGSLRRLLYLWARSDSIGNGAFNLHLDQKQPIVYVLPYRSLADLIVLDRECVKAGLPRPVRAPHGELIERESYVFLGSVTGCGVFPAEAVVRLQLDGNRAPAQAAGDRAAWPKNSRAFRPQSVAA